MKLTTKTIHNNSAMNKINGIIFSSELKTKKWKKRTNRKSISRNLSHAMWRETQQNSIWFFSSLGWERSEKTESNKIAAIERDEQTTKHEKNKAFSLFLSGCFLCLIFVQKWLNMMKKTRTSFSFRHFYDNLLRTQKNNNNKYWHLRPASIFREMHSLRAFETANKWWCKIN